MRRTFCFALLATTLALPAAASAACVTYTPGSTVLLGSPSGSPVQYVVRDPGSVSVTPTDCV